IGSELGTLTAEMHLALATGTNDARFSAEPASSDEIHEWQLHTRSSASQVMRALKHQLPDLDTRTADLANTVIASGARVSSDADGYSALQGFPLIRVHGDYHLGQVLRDEQGTWWVVDFEGEPLRPIAERTRKTSPLKDVAGMLRSFAYARGAAQAGGVDKASLEEWETRARADFIRSYLSSTRARMPGLLPAEDEVLFHALEAWELDKALYEVLYEIASRPDWLWLPLTGIAHRV
ncbi:MAG: phosphotransferase, partial [Thermomicrobiales bacterium]